MSIDLSNYLDIFADEAREHLQALNQALLGFEKEPGNTEFVNVMFRSAHTLKGMSATMGFTEVAELTHKMENLLSPIRQGELACSPEIIDLLFKCLDSLQEMVEAHISQEEHEVDIRELVTELLRLTASGSAPAPPPPPPAPPTPAPVEKPQAAVYPAASAPGLHDAVSTARNNGREVFHVHVVLDESCELRNVRSFMVLKELKSAGDILHCTPDEETLINKEYGCAFDLLLSTNDAESEIEHAGLSVLEVESVTAQVFKSEASASQAGPGVAQADLTSIFSLTEYTLSVVGQATEAGFRLDYIHVQLDAGCTLKSARAYMVNRKLEELGEIIAIKPDVEDIEFERFDRDLHFLLLTQAESGAIKPALNSISELDMIEVEEGAQLVAPTAAATTAPIPAAAPSAPAGAPPVEEAAAPAAEPDKPRAIQKADEEKKPIDKTADKARATQTIRVDTERLDALLNLVGELVIGKTRLAMLAGEIRRPDLTDTIEQFSHIVFDLQSVVMQTRMVPIETVFNRFPRMIRDLAKARGKQIELVMTGGETELDRTVIDEIGDPLVHLIRNALDHGIEPPQERTAKGKPPTGTLTLAAFHEGSHVFIQIRDDGAGIDPERTKHSAVKKGLITQEQADALTREQAVELIFAAGLSTVEQVTDISGRGVGMDAVRSKLDLLGGDIKVTTELGVGSTFSIKLPLTLAIVKALLVKIAGEDFAIPLSYIEETLRIQPSKIQKANQQDVILLRGEILPLIYMRQLLLSPDTPRETDDWFVVIVRSDTQRVGLCVDATIEMTEIVIKSLGKYLLNTRYISGGTILGDGTVALILDVAHLAA
jgi:two-component system, chemotaxis family, sensor kinase CheA